MKTILASLLIVATATTAAAQSSRSTPVYTPPPANPSSTRSIGSEDTRSNPPGVLGGILRAVTGEQDTSSVSLEQLTRNWQAEARQSAEQLYRKYGAPTEVSNQGIVWRNVGGMRAIEVRNEDVQHNFPFPHQDVVRTTIALSVPPEKMGELAQFSGSLIVDRTKGELSARCNNEQTNLIALNLANDIISNRLSAEQARSRFSELAQAVQQGQMPRYAAGIQFSANSTDTAFPDGPGANASQQTWQRIGW